MIEIKQLSKFYDKNKVLRDLNLTIKTGAVTGIVGPNACGKTTLMKCLLGLVVPTSGEVLIDGKKSGFKEDFRRQIGYMPQFPVFPDNLTLNELLDMLENLRGITATSRKYLIEYFNLDKFLEQPLDQLSGGTKQKISAVVAFMFDAPIIILDEPTVGLDPITAVLFKDLVLKMAKQGTTVIFVSHIMAEVEQLVSEVAFMNEGEILFSGAVSDLLKKTNALQLERAIIQLFKTKEENK